VEDINIKIINNFLKKVKKSQIKLLIKNSIGTPTLFFQIKEQDMI
jgi:hypothetical protein